MAPSPNGLYVAAADRKGGVAVFEVRMCVVIIGVDGCVWGCEAWW